MQERLDRLMAHQPTGMGRTAAVLVQRQGETLAEAYDTAGGKSADSELLSWSMAKSVTHALVGVLVGEGRLDLHQPAPVPEWQASGDPRGAITLDQLLKMRPGLKFVEDYVDDQTSDCLEMLFGSGQQDMAAYAAEQPLVHPPGKVLNYSSGTTNIVCRILADRVGAGDRFEAWARGVLFEPLGMSDVRLSFDPVGTWVGSSYLHTTTRNLAAFGNLYRRDGVTEDGRRLVPEGWVQHGSSPSGQDEEGNVYGAHWWVPDPEEGIYAAKGYETQRILVQPSSGLVVVRLGKTPVEHAPNVDAWLLEFFG